MAKCYFSAIEPKTMTVTIPTDWEVVNHADSWSDAIEALATVKDHFFAIPGYGDAVVHVERRVGRIHVFLHSFLENEISAKEVRSRILEASSSNDEETSEAEEGSFCTIYSPTSVVNSTLNKTGKTEYHSAIEDDQVQSVTASAFLSQLCLTFICDEISLAITDDCIQSTNQIDEFIRVTMDAVTFTVRPTTISAPGRSSQICLTLGDCQIDNQMYAKGSYDFPVVLKGHEVSNVRKLLPQDISQHWSKELMEKNHFRLDVIVEMDTQTEAVGPPMFLKAVTLKIRPMEVFIEDVFMYKMLQVIHSFGPTQQSSPSDDGLVNSDVKMAARCLAKPLFLE